MPSRTLRRAALAAASLVALAAPAAASAASPPNGDYAAQAYNILPAGAYGGLPTTQHSTDQVPLYDGLTPLRGNVTANDLRTKFLSERFGIGSDGPVTSTDDTGRPGLTIERDRFGVPHITGATRYDVDFGMGWVAAKDRGLLLQLGLGPAYAATLDIPGVNAFGLVTSGRKFVPSDQARKFVADQGVALVRRYGARGRQVLADFQSWVDGVNAYYEREVAPADRPPKATLTDAIAAFAFIGSIFGNGGGAEVRNADFLAKLERRFGRRGGTKIFRDLREVNDPEAPTTIPNRFPYDLQPKGRTPGSSLVDPGSESSAAADAATANRRASNALLVGPKGSATGNGLAVMGPQLGYFYPEIVMQVDVHGGGYDARGVAPPTMPYVLIGRGKDYAWSLTSADNDNRDQFLERLCVRGGGRPTRAARSYVYKGHCRAMKHFDAGTLDGKPVSFWETVHGPVGGTVTVNGRPYAVATKRATRGREPDSALFFEDMSRNVPTGPRSFFRVANELQTTFNIHYVDKRNIAYFSAGLLPRRARGVDPSLPTLGTGQWDWRGFISQNAHPHAANPRSGRILNWNNKPAPGWAAADSTWSYGSVHRVELFTGFPRRSRLEDVASVMNRAATIDLRAEINWPVIRKVLRRTAAPNALAAGAAAQVDAWVRSGADRLDRNLDGKIDAPGAAVLDQAYDGLALAVMKPVLGPLTADLENIQGISNDAGPGGSSYGGGWYGYVDKDLRTQLGDRVRGRYSRRYCGNGNLRVCSRSLWAAIAAAAAKLAATQGPNPAAWRSDATTERIKFAPGLIPTTMRWTNRPTFQQAIEFSGHR